jgi:metal-responsive CopG/Arc/MetJ family transcriptional regulator
MDQSLTVLLPREVIVALDEATRQEGISSNELVGKALKQYLLLRQYRLLRDRLVPKAQEQGIYTDQDVFHRVS